MRKNPEQEWHVFFSLQKLTSSLKIHKVEDHALYRCTVYNKIGEDSRIIFFHVTRKTPLCTFLR